MRKRRGVFVSEDLFQWQINSVVTLLHYAHIVFQQPAQPHLHV